MWDWPRSPGKTLAKQNLNSGLPSHCPMLYVTCDLPHSGHFYKGAEIGIAAASEMLLHHLLHSPPLVLTKTRIITHRT